MTFIPYLIPTIITLTTITAYPDYGFTGELTSDQSNRNAKEWIRVSGWKANSQAGFYSEGVTLGQAEDSFLINQEGVYVLSFKVILDIKKTGNGDFSNSSNRNASVTDSTSTTISPSEQQQGHTITEVEVAAVLDADTLNKRAIFSVETVDYNAAAVYGNGMFKIDRFQELSIYVRAKTLETISWSVSMGSFISLRWINSVGASPGFSAEMLVKSSTYSQKPMLGPWKAVYPWQYSSFTNFLTEQKSVQISCSGIYVIAVNLIVHQRWVGNISVLNLVGTASRTDNQTRVVKIISKMPLSAGTSTLAATDVFHIGRGSTINLELHTMEGTTVLGGSWSLQFLNKAENYSTGIKTSLTKPLVLMTSGALRIMSWSSFADGFLEFKSPKTFSLVSNRAFSPPSEDSYLISTQFHINSESFTQSTVVVSIYIGNKKIFSDQVQVNLRNVTYTLALTAAFYLKISDPVEIELSLQTNPNPGTILHIQGILGIVQFKSVHSGLTARMTTEISLTESKWTEMSHLTADISYGTFDFNQGLDPVKGKYTIPNDGAYIVFANVIAVDIDSEIKVLISIDGKIEIESGLYARDGNPAQTNTISTAGLLNLKRGQQVSVFTYAKDDSDWSIRKESGLSIGFLGEVAFGFRAHTSKVQSISQNAKTTVIFPWIINENKGKLQPSSQGSVLVGQTGIYYTMTTIILAEADSQQSGSTYTIQMYLNDKPISGLIATRTTSGVKESSTDRHYSLFFSGCFEAAKEQVLSIQVISTNDDKFQILDGSGWSLVFISSTEQATGFNAFLNGLQYALGAKADNWLTIESWTASQTQTGSFTASNLVFERGKEIIIPSKGIYAMSLNIILAYNKNSKPVFRVMLFNSDDMINAGLSYIQNKLYSEFSLHIAGVVYLKKGDRISVKITAAEDFGSAVLASSSNWCLLKLSRPASYAAVTTSLEKNLALVKSRTLIKDWSQSSGISDLNLLSWPEAIPRSGEWTATLPGLYLLSLNFMYDDVRQHAEGIKTLVVTNGTGSNTWTVRNDKRLKQASMIFMQDLGLSEILQIFSETSGNSSGHVVDSNQVNNSKDVNVELFLLDKSMISFLYLNRATKPSKYEARLQNTNLLDNFEGEIMAWEVPDSVSINSGVFLTTQSGFHLITVTVQVSNFTGTLEIMIDIDNNRFLILKEEEDRNNGTSFQAAWSGHIDANKEVKFIFKTGANSRVNLGGKVRREVYILDSSGDLTVGAVKFEKKTYAQDRLQEWISLHPWDKDQNTGFKGSLVYTNEYIVVRDTGIYLVMVRLIFEKVETFESHTNLTIKIATSNAGSYLNGLSTTRSITAGKSFTIIFSSAIFVEKWSKVGVLIQLGNQNDKAVLREGSGMTILYIYNLVTTSCPDPGPYIPGPLTPSVVQSGIVGEKRSWKCNAFADGTPTYTWWKNEKEFKTENPDTLQINGLMEDSGEYYCQASYLGYTVKSSKININIFDVDECFYGNHTCSAESECKNTPGSFSCSCREGFHGTQNNCSDIDECVTNTNDCHKHAECKNLIGGFSCTCKIGYEGDGKKECNDIKECAIFNPTCDTNARCRENGPSYGCVCNDGWSGNGQTCVDLDECETNTHNCHVNSTCENLNGTYTCHCNKGYKGNGFNCTDVNECIERNNSCQDVAECENIIGGFRCHCKKGFKGNGTYCHDINECLVSPLSSICGSSADCTNTYGSYKCICHLGLTGENGICRDLDECLEKDRYCDPLANCTNAYSSYTCTCPRGYVGNGKTCTKTSSVGQLTDPCEKDLSSLQCICKDSNARDENILCNGLFVAIIILVVVAVIVVVFGFKYIKSRRITKIAPARTAKGKYVEMEDETEV